MINLGRKVKLRLLAIPTLMFLLVGQASSDQHAEFLDLLEYEVNNREFGYLGAKAMVERGDNDDIANFWQAFLALELQHREAYKNIAQKYGLSANVTVAKVKVRLSVLSTALFPQWMADNMAEATPAYVKKLERLLSLAPPEDHEFLSYVVAQEKAQARAFIYLARAEIDLATNALEMFVAGNLDKVKRF